MARESFLPPTPTPHTIVLDLLTSKKTRSICLRLWFSRTPSWTAEFQANAQPGLTGQWEQLSRWYITVGNTWIAHYTRSLLSLALRLPEQPKLAIFENKFLFHSPSTPLSYLVICEASQPGARHLGGLQCPLPPQAMPEWPGVVLGTTTAKILCTWKGNHTKAGRRGKMGTKKSREEWLLAIAVCMSVMSQHALVWFC